VIVAAVVLFFVIGVIGTRLIALPITQIPGM
jgi:hypothetical protein